MEIIRKYFDDFTPLQLIQFEQLYPLYHALNQQVNVVSRKDIEQLYEKHVLHALSIATLFEFTSGQHVIDLGTGGGFPGIPLAIFFPEVQFTLVDSIGKKIGVVEQVIHAIGLKNAIAIKGRVEEVCSKASAHFVVSRAVAPLGKLWQWSKPLLMKKSEGEWANGLICLKGGDLHAEISESGCKPMMWSIGDLFEEPFFKEKYILYVKR